MTAKLTGEDVELSADEKWQSLGYLLHLGDQTSCTVSIIGPRWIMTSHSCVSRYVLFLFQFVLLIFLNSQIMLAHYLLGANMEQKSCSL